jgi:hypothetical protein
MADDSLLKDSGIAGICLVLLTGIGYGLKWIGTEQHQVHAQTKLTTGADSQHISASGIVRVTSANTDIDLRVRHDNGGSVNLTPVYANITVDYLGE